jgi:transcriptional regulator with XRE-family HTH domain
MADRFGDLLRKLRRNADKTLGDVARALGISVVYVSDVERGNRNPFSTERILKVAEFLKADAEPLIAAAERENGFIEYDLRKAPPLEAHVVGGLIHGLARGGVSEEQLEKIQEILGEAKR